MPFKNCNCLVALKGKKLTKAAVRFPYHIRLLNQKKELVVLLINEDVLCVTTDKGSSYPDLKEINFCWHCQYFCWFSTLNQNLWTFIVNSSIRNKKSCSNKINKSLMEKVVKERDDRHHSGAMDKCLRTLSIMHF